MQGGEETVIVFVKTGKQHAIFRNAIVQPTMWYQTL
jgi:hypothetical protein